MERDLWSKLFMFICTRIIMIIIIFLIIVFVGFTAYDTTNAYLILNQALEKRAEIVIKNGDEQVLDNYFTEDMDQNKIWLNNRFKDIEVDTYNYNVDVQWLFPWFGKANAVVEEKVEDIVAKNVDNKTIIPQWDNGPKKIKMKKVNGIWKIADIQQHP